MFSSEGNDFCGYIVITREIVVKGFIGKRGLEKEINRDHSQAGIKLISSKDKGTRLKIRYILNHSKWPFTRMGETYRHKERQLELFGKFL